MQFLIWAAMMMGIFDGVDSGASPSGKGETGGAGAYDGGLPPPPFWSPKL